MSSIIQIKRAKTDEWGKNYVLQQGEYGVDMGTEDPPEAADFKIKIGDGVTEWQDLPVISGSGVEDGVYVKQFGDNMTGDLTFGMSEVKIRLHADTGKGEFSGDVFAQDVIARGVKVSGGTLNGIQNGMRLSTTGDTQLLHGGKVMISSVGDSRCNIARYTTIQADLNTGDQVVQGNAVENINKDKALVSIFTASPTEVENSATLDEFRGYSVVLGGNTKYGTNSYAYYSQATDSNVSGQNNYNFYAAGSAPNYFKGLTEFAVGVKVTGEETIDPDESAGRITYDDGGKRIQFWVDGNKTHIITASNGSLTSQLNDTFDDPASANSLKHFVAQGNYTANKNYVGGYEYQPTTVTGEIGKIRGVYASGTNLNDKVTEANAIEVTNWFKAQKNNGIRLAVGASVGKENFSINSVGDAPSFFAANTYIGGTTTRNTRELWESTLTEEQKEQLTAGTLAVPANVSTPGDGSFVRQWWYDQQSAEDQASIDAGELEYPSHFQAANFVDTFDLGDNTNLDLKSDGVAALKGIAFNKGGIGATAIGNKGFYYGSTIKAPVIINYSENDGDNVIALRGSYAKQSAGGLFPVESPANGITIFSAAGAIDVTDTTYNSLKGFAWQSASENQQSNNSSIYGFWTDQNKAASSKTDVQTYGFYSEGNAPNFFAGDTYIGGSTTRNTRQLWESTLTEEQKEQLAAGTLVIPANVETPGDGSFARQWWYDQQSAEDQALIDSGELDYPERYQAANFVDTFDLGDNTRTDLLSTGNAKFKTSNQDAFVSIEQGNNSLEKIISVQRAGGPIGNNVAFGISAKNSSNGDAYETAFSIAYGGKHTYNTGNATFNVVDSAFDAGATKASFQVQFNGDIQATVNTLGRFDSKMDKKPTSDTVVGFQTNGDVPLASGSLSVIGYRADAGLVTDHPTELYTGFQANGAEAAKGKPKVAVAFDTVGFGALGQDNTYGFRSNLAASGTKNYNFYAGGSAPNFFAGDTYIGGTTVRNTRELWESTLTEEQKEQLTAGTLAIPSNVSVPGDGSFARQWWYDQQSAEDQALIDSGELEYPTPLAAATFTDTFSLGDNTKINLLSSGLGEFGSGVKVNGGSASAIGTGLRKQGSSVRLVNNDIDMITAATTQTSFNGRVVVGNQGLNLTSGNGLLVKNDLQFASGDCSVLMVNPETISGTYDKLSLITARTKSSTAFKCEEYIGVEIQQPIAASNMTRQDGSKTPLTGISTTINGGNNLNINANGTAPSYFRGDVTGGGADKANANWSIAADGTASGITVTRASVVTDEQAGTVETLLDIIKDLRGRLAALESGEIIDDATDSSLLSLVTDLSTRVSALESA